MPSKTLRPKDSIRRDDRDYNSYPETSESFSGAIESWYKDINIDVYSVFTWEFKSEWQKETQVKNQHLMYKNYKGPFRGSGQAQVKRCGAVVAPVGCGAVPVSRVRWRV